MLFLDDVAVFEQETAISFPGPMLNPLLHTFSIIETGQIDLATMCDCVWDGVATFMYVKSIHPSLWNTGMLKMR